MKLMKKILAVGLVAVMAISSAACSMGTDKSVSENIAAKSKEAANDSDTGAAAADGENSQKADLTVWLTPQWKGVFDASEDGADYDSFLKEAARRYTEKNPNVNINVEVIDASSRDENLSVAANTDTLPDIVFEGAFTLSSYYHKGNILPITDIVDDTARSDISENIWDIVSIEDEVFMYPFFHMPGTLIYNADMFKAAGLEDKIGGEHEIVTWSPEEFRAILEALKKANPNVYPLSFYALNNQADTWTLAYLRMFGSEFFDKDNKLVANDEKGVKALQYILDLYKDGLTVPGAESLDSNTCNAMFQNQQIAISFTNSVLMKNLGADMENGKLPKFDYRLCNIPGSPDPKSFTYVTGAVVMNTKDDVRIAAAKDFVKFFCTDEELVVASKNGMPVRASVVDKVGDELKYLKAYTGNNKYIFNFSRNLPAYSELRNALFPEIQAALMGSKTAQQALDDYVANGNKIIEEGMASSVIYNK